jgi:NAD(P)-dependent dehydrogenase (short-subunit alcohol dehydrogenase family)
MSILITGGTKGIGLAIAKRFAQPGVDVFLNYAHDDAAAERASAELSALPARVHLIKRSCQTPEDARAILDEVSRHTKQLDQLVHCAVRALPARVLEVDPHAFTEAVQLNGLALLYLVQAALPLFVRGSSVVFLSSRGGRVPLPHYAAVGVGKALAESLVRYLAVELAPRGVRINGVAPSVVATDALKQVFGANAERMVAEAAAQNPSGRSIRDDDYTSLIAFLASPEAEFIQGQIIAVNGGQNLMG